MKLVVAMIALLGVTSLGCAGVMSPVGLGFIYTGVQGPINATEAAGATRTGQSCAQNVLGIAAWGDASIDAAKQDGGISTVSSVDHDSLSVLLIYARFCTVVKGS